MADGLNQARAMRIAEIMGDFRNIQHYIASIRARPSNEEYNEEGFVLLRRCVAEAQALLAQPFQTASSNNGKGGEQEKRGELRRYVESALWGMQGADHDSKGSSSTPQSAASKHRRSTSAPWPRYGGLMRGRPC